MDQLHGVKRDVPHTLEEIRSSCELRVGKDGKLLEVCLVTEELLQGLDMLSKHKKLITVYGSAQFDVSHHLMCQKAEELGSRLVKEVGAGVITGGGPGIMEAANKGAFEAGGTSVGATIVIPTEQTTNPYVNVVVPFQYFFTRKTALRFGTEMAVCFPGGYGTLDELFELLNLIKTGKISQIPVVLYGEAFWRPLDAYLKNTLEEQFGSIAPDDRNLYIITDSLDEVVDIARQAPTKEGHINK